MQAIAPWERAAADLALRYLDQGAAGWWESLAADSWLAALGPEAAAVEIGVRAGPREGAAWELQTVLASDEGPAPAAASNAAPARGTAVFWVRYTSGIDDVLVLDLVEQGGEWRLHDLWTWAEPRSARAGSPPVHGTPADGTLTGPALAALPLADGAPGVPPTGEPSLARSDSAEASSEAAGGRRPRAPLLTPTQRVLGPLAGLVLLIVASSVRRRSRLLAWLLLVLGLAFLVLSLVLPGPIPWDMEVPPPGSDREAPPSEADPPPEVEPPADPRSLAVLAPLRAQVLAGRPEAELGDLPLGDGAPAAIVATLWRARRRLLQGDLPGTASLLEGLPSPYPSALGDLLHGRLGAARGETTEAVLGHQRAMAKLPAFDGLMLEAADALVENGFDSRAEALYQRLAEGGSRLARVHDRLVARAVYGTLTGSDEKLAVRHLRAAWKLEPSERAAWLADPVRSYLVRRHDLFRLLDLSNPREPAPVARPGGHPLVVPPGFTATYTGELLWIARGQSELVIPGASDLIPASATPEDAARRQRRQEARILDELALDGPAPSPFLERAKLETAALALARAHRWAELVSVTEPLAESAAQSGAVRPVHLPPTVGQLRAEGLRRAGRHEEATRLLVEVAKSNAVLGRKDPGALFQLARLLTEAEQWDLAVRAEQTAEAQLIEPPMTSWVPRIRMERRLAQAYETHASRHFEVRYPRGTNTYFVERLTEVLEKEALRLRQWIPYEPTAPIEVHLFPFREFFQLYSQGGEVLGLFDGKVRVPLAELPSLHPSVVAVLTHEVAHALIAGATEDRAPAWLHEGLAQHVQMLQNQINPVPDYHRQGQLVAFPLLDSILDGRSDSQLTGLAYEEALWAVHFFEARHGRRSIHRLLEAFREGRDTEQAVAAVTGQSLPAFDADLWGWAMTQTTWATEIVRYDK